MGPVVWECFTVGSHKHHVHASRVRGEAKSHSQLTPGLPCIPSHPHSHSHPLFCLFSASSLSLLLCLFFPASSLPLLCLFLALQTLHLGEQRGTEIHIEGFKSSFFIVLLCYILPEDTRPRAPTCGPCGRNALSNLPLSRGHIHVYSPHP